MVCWVEPSAQNSIYILNNPSHKKTSRAEFLSALACAEPPRSGAEPPCSNAEAPGSMLTRLFCGWRGWYLYHTPSPPTVIFFVIHLDSKWSSISHLSLVLPTSLLKSLWFLEGFGSRECEKAREDPSPLFLCTWWSPSRLVCLLLLELGSQVASSLSVAPNPLWLSTGKFVLPFVT